jgi:hypothetical protein
MPKRKKSYGVLRKVNTSVEPIVINPLQSEVDEAREVLIQHFTHLPKFEGDPIAKANEVIEACRVGWMNSPKTFYERIRQKAKFRHSGGANMMTWAEVNSVEASKDIAIAQQFDKNSPRPLPRLLPSEEIIDHLGREKILRALNNADKKFWKQRENYYRREFDFNSSSDFTLLIEVISNELKIAKIHQMEFEELEKKPVANDPMSGPDAQKLLALSKMTIDAHKQLQESLKALGVTRDQRKEELDMSDGDLASLSMSLDKKLRAQTAIDAANREEEELGLRRKYLRGDVYNAGLERAIHNQIPQSEEIAEIIKESGIALDEGDPRGSSN